MLLVDKVLIRLSKIAVWGEGGGRAEGFRNHASVSTRASAPTMGAEEGGGGASGDFRIEPLEIGRRDNNGGVTERGRVGGGW